MYCTEGTLGREVLYNPKVSSAVALNGWLNFKRGCCEVSFMLPPPSYSHAERPWSVQSHHSIHTPLLGGDTWSKYCRYIKVKLKAVLDAAMRDLSESFALWVLLFYAAFGTGCIHEIHNLSLALVAGSQQASILLGPSCAVFSDLSTGYRNLHCRVSFDVLVNNSTVLV